MFTTPAVDLVPLMTRFGQRGHFSRRHSRVRSPPEFVAFTMEAVAARADTSRAVLYRRWAAKNELVRAVIEHITRPDEMKVADTGSLRGDTIAMMKVANRTRLELVTAMTAHLGGYYQATGTSPADLRKTLFLNRPHIPRLLLERTVARGEVHPALAVPYTILQQEFHDAQPGAEYGARGDRRHIFRPLVASAPKRPGPNKVPTR